MDGQRGYQEPRRRPTGYFHINNALPATRTYKFTINFCMIFINNILPWENSCYPRVWLKVISIREFLPPASGSLPMNLSEI